MDDNSNREQIQNKSPNESFRCTFEGCGKTFSSLAILCTHEAVCGKAGFTPKASCEICGSRTSKLKQHMLLHEPPRHQCPICKKMFHFRYNMTAHLKIHARELDPLGKDSNEETQILLEMVAVPPQPTIRKPEPVNFPCTVCRSVFKKKESLQYHLNIHNGLTPYKCRNEGCDEAFASHLRRRKHERVCRGETSKKACKVCGLEVYESNLAKHMQRAHEDVQTDRKPAIKDKLYPCGQCSAVLKSEKALISHVNQHEGIKPYSCRNEGCRESFTGETSRGKHEKLCRETASTCPVCGLALANWLVRQDHMAAFHKDDTVLAEMLELGLPKEEPPKKVPKEDPPKKVPKTICLNKLPDGRKKCPECGKIFSQQKSFVYHMNKHKGVQPYACVKCSQTFFSKFNHTYHEKKCLAGLTVRKIRDSQSSEPPKERKQKSNKPKAVLKQCEFCNQTLRSERMYEKHMVVHNGAGVYRCNHKDCTELFQTFRKRQLHEAEQHGSIKDAPQLECSNYLGKYSTRQHLKTHQENEHQPEEEYAELESTITIKEEEIQWDDDDDEIVGI